MLGSVPAPKDTIREKAVGYGWMILILYFLKNEKFVRTNITPPHLPFAEFCLFDTCDEGPKHTHYVLTATQKRNNYHLSRADIMLSCTSYPHADSVCHKMIDWRLRHHKESSAPCQSVHTHTQMLDVSLSASICMTTMLLTFPLTEQTRCLFDTKYNQPLNRCTEYCKQ